MRTLLLLVITASLLVSTATPSQAAPAAAELDVAKCLELTRESGLDTKKIVAGLGLSAEQIRATRARLAQYNSVRGFPGIDGLGLTPDQLREIQRRIAVQVAAMHAHPLGWPCSPFKNTPAVIQWLRAKLIANGFRPASLNFTPTSPRQVQFQGIQDGVRLLGVMVKSAAREVTVGLQAPGWGRTYMFGVPFEV